MEAAVRNLLARAEEDKNELFLHEAYEKLERGRKGSSAQTDPFNSDQYVVCAEVALKVSVFNFLVFHCDFVFNDSEFSDSDPMSLFTLSIICRKKNVHFTQKSHKAHL